MIVAIAVLSAAFLIPAGIALFRASHHDQRGITHAKDVQTCNRPK